MIINDSVFGKLEYDLVWSRDTTIDFFGNEVEIALIVKGDEKAAQLADKAITGAKNLFQMPQEVLNQSYFRADISIPIFITGFGEVVTWEENRYIRMVRFKDGNLKGIASGFNYFWEDLSTDIFEEDYFEYTSYREAVAMHGSLSFDECFGDVPLLGLGGAKKVKNLKK